MAIRQPRYSKEEFSRRGHEIYDRVVRPIVRPGDEYKFVAIDIETENYEIDSDSMLATERICSRNPDAQPWVMLANGEPAVRMGFRGTFRRVES